MIRTAVVLLLTTPMAASSAMMAAMVSSLRVAGDGDHVEAHRADAVMASSFSMVRAPCLGRLDHALVLAHRDEGAGEAADEGRGHEPALLDRVVQEHEGRGGAGRAAALQPDLLEDGGHAVADRRGRGERQVHDAEGDVQAPRRLAGHQLADAGDLEGGPLDGLGDGVQVAPLDLFQRALDHAGPADPDVDDGLRLARCRGRRRP